MIESSDSSSDSDVDVFEALKSSDELQSYMRQHIRKEIADIGPKLFEQLKTEMGLKDVAIKEENGIPAPVMDDLRESWHLDEEEEKAPTGEAAEEVPIGDDIRQSITKAINE